MYTSHHFKFAADWKYKYWNMNSASIRCLLLSPFVIVYTYNRIWNSKNLVIIQQKLKL